MVRTRHGSGSVSRGSHTGGGLTDFRSPGGTVISNPVWGSNVTSDDGSLGLVTALEITPGSVDSGSLVPGTALENISPYSIDGTYLGYNSVTAYAIAAGTITADEIATGTITATQIASDTITANEIASDTITANEIASGTITANEIAANAITAEMISGTTISGVNFHAGGGVGTQITVYDSSNNAIGYWDSQGLHVYDGKFYLEGMALRYAISNSVGFWDFQGRALRANKGLVTVDYAGAITDYVMDYMTLNGALAVDAYNGRIYYRYGGSWHYSAETAGFEIPVHETICPVCDLPMLPGQDFIGRGDRINPEGSVHAYYIHLGCAGIPMNPFIAADYEKVTKHADLDADPKAKEDHEALLRKLTRKARKALGLREDVPEPVKVKGT